MTTHAIPDLDPRGLRNFALTIGAVLAALFGLVLPFLLGLDYRAWPWVVAAILVVWGLGHPGSLKPVYRIWMRFGLLLHRVTTPAILGLVFFVLFTPVALGMRVFGRDTMRRRFDRGCATYRKPVQPRETKSMENPF